MALLPPSFLYFTKAERADPPSFKLKQNVNQTS